MFPVCALFSTRGVFPNFSCLLYLNLLPISFASTPEKFPASAFSISLVSFFPFPQPYRCFLFSLFYKTWGVSYTFFSTLSFPYSRSNSHSSLLIFCFAFLHSESKVKLFSSESAERFWCNVYIPSVVWNLLKILFDLYSTHSNTVLFLWFSVSMVQLSQLGIFMKILGDFLYSTLILQFFPFWKGITVCRLQKISPLFHDASVPRSHPRRTDF